MNILSSLLRCIGIQIFDHILVYYTYVDLNRFLYIENLWWYIFWMGQFVLSLLTLRLAMHRNDKCAHSSWSIMQKNSTGRVSITGAHAQQGGHGKALCIPSSNLCSNSRSRNRERETGQFLAWHGILNRILNQSWERWWNLKLFSSVFRYHLGNCSTLHLIYSVVHSPFQYSNITC